MKKLIKLIALFYDSEQYEIRLRDEMARVQSELRYCQDLLFQEVVNRDITPEKQAEINVYVALIRENKKREGMIRFNKTI